MNTITLQAGESVTIVAAGTAPVEPPVIPPVEPPVVIPPPTGNGQRHEIDLGPWGDAKKTGILFNVEDEVSVAFHTGSGPSQTSNLPNIHAAEGAASFADMIAAISDTPFKYDALTPGSAGAVPSFRVNNPIDPPSFPYPNYYANLDPNRTYYFNLKNAPGNGVTGTRNIYVELKVNGCP